MYDYGNLEKLMKERGVSRSELGNRLGISSRTIAKISKGEKISGNVLGKISDFMVCEPGFLYRVVSDNPLLQLLREEKEAGVSGGIYHELQVRMTYSSNHMEGSRLTEDQTRMIFETDTIDSGDGVPVDDIIETVHHFRAIDYCIDFADEPLSEDMIKYMHGMLKRDTRDSRLAWFAVGEYKRRANMVGGEATTAPEDVASEMGKLLSEYLEKDRVDLADIVEFHARFERIHPFQDGNGRVGRLIAFKECLKHSIVPFIIEDSKKSYYYRGLARWNSEREFLMDTCLDGQDAVNKLLKDLGFTDDRKQD